MIRGAASAAAMTRELRALGDPEVAQFLQGFFKTGIGEYGEGDVFLGIRVPATRRLVARHRDASLTEVATLLQSRFHEARLLALLILVHRFQRGDSETRRIVYATYRSHLRWVNNWDLVDGSAEHIMGGYLMDRSRRPLYQLARSPNLWRRRIAIMATFHFVRHGAFGETFGVADVLLDDDHDLIHKAVGWMLREVGKRDRPAEESFLEQRYRIMPRTMLRYAIEHFPARRRRAYLQGAV